MALPEKKAQPKILGPYGWEFLKTDDGYIPRPLATEIWVIRYMKQLYAFCGDIDEIAAELRYDRLRPRHGGAWSREEIAALLKRDDEVLWQHWKERRPYPVDNS